MGQQFLEKSDKPIEEALEDTFRVNYYREYLKEVSKAIYDNGVNVKGYFAWSLMDNFEWGDGYSKRFGLYYVDFKNNQKRYPKKSVSFFQQLLQK